MNQDNIKIGSNRIFGLFFSFIFLIISLWPLKNGYEIRNWSLIISIIFFILGIMNSKILTPFNKARMRFGFFLGKVISPIVMGVIYFAVVTPIGLLMRIFGKDILNLKKNNKNTYWLDKEIKKSSMKNQF